MSSSDVCVAGNGAFTSSHQLRWLTSVNQESKDAFRAQSATNSFRTATLRFFIHFILLPLLRCSFYLLCIPSVEGSTNIRQSTHRIDLSWVNSTSWRRWNQVLNWDISVMSHHREGDGVNRSLPFWCFEDDGDLCIILILGLLLLSYDLDNSCYKLKSYFILISF